MQRDLQGLRRAATSVDRARARRDEKIAEATRAGATRRQVAEASGLSLGKVQKILARLGLVTLLLLVFCGSAQATTIMVEDGAPDHPYQQWVNKAKVATPDLTIHVIEDPTRCGAEGCAEPPDPDPCAGQPNCSSNPVPDLRSRIWIDPTLSERKVRHVFYHEVGHHFDYAHLTDADRAWFAAEVFQIPNAEWKEETLAPHDEEFAEVYWGCAQRKRPRAGFWLGADHVRRGCRYLRAHFGS